MNSEPYELSGKATAAWLLPLIGIASATSSAFVYAWVDVYSPIAGYVSLLFVGGLAMGAVWPVALAGRWLKVRSVMQMRIAGVATGVAAVYLAWAFFAWVMLRRADANAAPSAFDLVESPAALWDFAGLVAADGWYSIRGATPSGLVLWTFWAIEAAIVVGAGYLFAPAKILGCGFCEDCGTWMVDEVPIIVPVGDGASIRDVRRDGLGGITAFPLDGATGDRHQIGISAQRCPSCSRAAVYRIDELTVVFKEGKREIETAPLQPLSWLRTAEQAEFDRIAAMAKAALASPTAPTA